MRKVLFIFLTVRLLRVSPSIAEQIIHLDPVIDCGLQPTGEVVQLREGENRFQWISGAYTYWAFENAWLTYTDCYIHVLGETQYIGMPDYFDTYDQASEFSAGRIFSIWTPTDSPATLFLNDYPCGDNKGNMTIKFLDPPVASTSIEWGRIKSLYRLP